MNNITIKETTRQIPDRPVALVSWDGHSQPWDMMHLNSQPEFECLLFDYSGRHSAGRTTLRGLECTVLSSRTECKGEIYQALATFLIEKRVSPEYVALIDDDIVISFGDINRALHLARVAHLDVFSPALSHDSEYSHDFTLRQSNVFYRETDWVEVMMPFYRGELFLAGATHFKGNISSWGIDRYLIPTLQLILNMPHTAIIDTVIAMHTRPISSGKKVFANGLTAYQECENMKSHCLTLIESINPSIKHKDLYRRIFSNDKKKSRAFKWAQLQGKRVFP